MNESLSQNTSSGDFLPLPEKIGPYKIQSQINQGGMSVLFIGLHPETGQPIIVKVLSQKFLENSEVTARFLAEAEIIAVADHPNIVKLLGSGTWEKGLYIAMEYVHGYSLKQILNTTPLSLKRALEIVLDIAYALCHLHTHHVIHRDLKPENILITTTGKVKVIDFGISQLLFSKEQSPDQKKRFIGTPIYMSPEQRENPEKVSYPSDIYSLGIITYELVLGRASQGQIHLSLMPKGLQKILTKALLPNPDERYNDCVDFIADLSHYLHSNLPEKEKRPQDRLADDFDQLRQSGLNWLEPALPDWKSPTVRLAYSPPLSFPSLFWTFFEEGDKKGLILIETCAMPEGSSFSSPLIALAWIKGLINGLVESQSELLSQPERLASRLSDKIFLEKTIGPHLFAYLSVDVKEKKALYLSAGEIEMLKISKDQNTVYPAEQMPLGLEEKKIFTSQLIDLENKDLFLIYPLPKQAEAILSGKTLDERRLMLKLADPKKFETRAPYLFEMNFFHGK